MGVDLHRIGTGISSGTSRTGFGTIVSFPSGAGAPSGVAYTVYGVEYPIAEGGESVVVNELSYNTYASEICDVDYVYEGFPPYAAVVDWSSARNIIYRPNGYYFGGDGTLASQSPMEVPSESSIYYDSEYVTEYAALANGSGGYTWTAQGVGYWDADTLIYSNEYNEYYYWDGNGGFYIEYP